MAVSLGVRRPTPPLRFVHGDLTTHPSVGVVNDPADLAPVDLLIVATKSHDVPALEHWLRSAACADAFVIVAQNGVEQVARLAPYFDDGRIAPAIVTYGAERRRPGVVVQTLDGTTRVPATDVGRFFAKLADSSELDVEVVDDFMTAMWTKLAWNLVGNSLTTIADVPVCAVGQRPELRELATGLVDECRRVARGHGADLDELIPEAMLDELATYAPTVHTSMWQDRQAGRPFEHQAISGAIVRGAEVLGIDAPYSRAVTAILETLSPGATMCPPERSTRTEVTSA